ncbi:MAG: carboxypeptidase regulatory-like domain-containing protein, partial [Blastocatellia bacterium]|nr:carboxypeptidase regulatory-like domain-containing protein [Blastocatellia bacterium]
MKKKSLLDSIDVPKPCDKIWDEMIGNDVSRFCLHCEKDIYNISAMTRKEAKKLLFQSSEKVCIRMEKEANGRIKTLKKQLHQITRQMPLAAGVLTASMILSGVTNAQETKVETGKITITQITNKNSKPIIWGIITDSNGAVIPGVKVILRNTKDNSIRFATSNDNGFYEFKDVEVATYEIEIVEQRG